VNDRGRFLVRLDTALYGCIQSAKLSYDNLTEFLRSIGFKHNGVDPCVMNKIINGKHMTLVLFVDDILILSERDADTERFIKQLRDKYIEVSFCVDSNLSYLGMHVRVEAGKTVLSMRSYVETMLKELSVTGVAASLATGKLFECDDITLLMANRKKKFHTTVAKTPSPSHCKARFFEG
jgi:hypothetical protein